MSGISGFLDRLMPARTGGASQPERNWFWGPIPILLLLGAFFIPFTLMLRKSVTFDEVVHLPAGYSYLRSGRIVLNPMHPPLIKEICALPLLWLDVRMPVDAQAIERASGRPTYQWQFGKKFFASQDTDRIVFWGRMPAILLSLGLAALIMKWAAELWGRAGGLLAGFLYVFDPTITAHAPLITTDVGMAFFGVLFLYVLRKCVSSPSPVRIALSGVALGLALGSKFSAIALVPVAVTLVLFARPQTVTARWSIAARLGALAAMFSIAYVALWAIYLFPRDPLFYLRGLEALKADANLAYEAVFMGRAIERGSPSYLLIAWLVKTPLPSLLLLLAAVVSFLRGQRARTLEEAFLWLPALALFIPAALFAAPLGVRYMIPCLPFAFIFTARIAPHIDQRRWIATSLTALLAWYVAEFVAISPDHLAYFNELAGGARGGLWWLSDSNVDWGQGLIELRDYLAAHPGQKYRLCYFGSFEPRYYGLGEERVNVDDLISGPVPGTLILSAYCVSLAQAKIAVRHGYGTENWLAHATPKTVIGHAYYVYEVPSG